MKYTGLIHNLHLRNLRGDIYGGLTAAVVALPLALAMGVTSGAGPTAGLYGAIFTQYSSIAPQTGPMLAFTVVMMGGRFQILFGVLRIDRYIVLMPNPVICGFMSGIGAIILLLQLGPYSGMSALLRRWTH